jgi:predicted nuclease with TOPRIM domain
MTSVPLQEAQQSGIQELLKKQQESEKAFRDNVFTATEKLDAENRSLTEKCKKQDDILRLQQQQFDECSATIDQAKKVCLQKFSRSECMKGFLTNRTFVLGGTAVKV